MKVARIIGLILLWGLSVSIAASQYSVKDSRLQIIGRHALSKDGKAIHYDWAGVQLRFKVKSPSVRIKIEDGASDYNVFVNGQLQEVIKTKPDHDMVSVKLGNEISEVWLTKRNDGNYGMAIFKGVELPKNGELLDPPARAARRLEFVGDSITVGYGNEGPNKECQITRPHENNWLSYASLTSRNLNAEAHITAISGKGIVRNYAEATQISRNPMPYYYKRAVMRNGAALWNFQEFVPDAVFVKLGTNDISTQPNPSDEQMLEGYRNLIKQIRDSNGENIPLFMISKSNQPNLVKFNKKIVEEEQAKGHAKTWYVEFDGPKEEDLGCHWHPKAVVHQRMSQMLTQIVKEKLNW